MATLGTTDKTLEIIRKHGFHFQKKYGQNFLVNPQILKHIVGSAGIMAEDVVLEIGPGIGTMTQLLCEKAKFVIAVEIDKNLIPILEDTLRSYDNKIILNADILKLDLEELFQKYAQDQPVKVVANLPYYITTPIIMGLFESKISLESITVMIQKEVAIRMQSGPGSKDYGALSLAVQYYARPEVVAEVEPECFIPRPNVTSSVIRLTKFKKPPVETKSEELLFRLIRAAFNHRRKTLQNCLASSGELSISKERAAQLLREMGLDERIRGEALTLSEFAELADRLG